ANVEQRENEIQVDVVWQAQSTPDTDYTVFVQLLNADGQFLTGSDAQPAGGERPTSGWIPTEYITDSHLIKLDSVNYRGDATIIVGMYNPVNGERVLLLSGGDFVQIPVELEIR
ncbi:MAG TPA: hypothetical protein VJZ27_16950, partial [Aggregatilineales bacterium]|nr:hypothetical protein [Aggregatilineales bacterium]